MRGEDDDERDQRERHKGSPPHARGRRGITSWKSSGSRITPACAGKTSTAEKYTFFCTDHPRMRGEDEPAQDGQWYSAGSPPHARGRLLPGPLRAAARGITPACAGKTPAPSRRSPRTGDHPRMRGEDPWLAGRRPCWRGSPPHARGRPSKAVRTCCRSRITPACAGKTYIATMGAWLMGGSPPHARGRRDVS